MVWSYPNEFWLFSWSKFETPDSVVLFLNLGPVTLALEY